MFTVLLGSGSMSYAGVSAPANTQLRGCAMAPTARTSARRRSAPPIAARLRVFRPDDIALERKVGQLGILNVSR